MSKEKWFVNDSGKKYEWKEVEDDLLDTEKVGAGYMFGVLAFVVFVNSAVSSALFIGIIRTIALKISPNVPVEWLVPELQLLAFIAIAWLIVIQCLLVIVHARIGRLLAIDEQ